MIFIQLYTNTLQGDVTAVFGRISYFRTWLEGEMQGAAVCRNGFDADTALPRDLTPRSSQPRPPVHTRMNVGNTKRVKKNKKNKKGKKNNKKE